MSMTFYDNWATNNFDRIAKLAEVGGKDKDFSKRYAFIIQEETEKLVNEQQEKIQSLEKEVARLKEENLAMRNWRNCKEPDSCNKPVVFCPCDKWEIKK